MANPFELDWGEVTPEGFDNNKNQALHVLNCFMQSPESRRLVLIYLIGRIVWFNKHLPPGCCHRIRIDTGGQFISVNVLNKWREAALSKIRERLPAVQIEIEFLV
jgi:hypothetical protein